MADEVVSPHLLTNSIESWNRPGFNVGMDDWFTEDPPPAKTKCLSLTRRSSPLQDSTNQKRFAKPVDAAVLQTSSVGPNRGRLLPPTVFHPIYCVAMMLK